MTDLIELLNEIFVKYNVSEEDADLVAEEIYRIWEVEEGEQVPVEEDSFEDDYAEEE